jgi:hypothetical protein
MFNPALDMEGKPWRGPREKSDVFFQILIEACSMPGSIFADLSASTEASLKACRASGKHFFGLEADRDIYEGLLKPMLNPEVDEGWNKNFLTHLTCIMFTVIMA